MKILKEKFRNFENDKFHRFVFNVETSSEEHDFSQNSFLSGKDRGILDEEGKKEELESILSNPIKFSFRDIRFLEKNIELVEQDLSLKKKLQDTAIYFLSLAQSDIVKKMPPRILYEIIGSSKIRCLLPLKLEETMQKVVDQDLKTLVQKESFNWSTQETAQVCSLYRHLRKKYTLGGKLNPLFSQITEKLTQKAMDFAMRNVEGEGRTVSGKKELETHEKLLLWEIRKILPSEVWAEIEYSHDVTAIGEMEASKLLDQICSNEMQNNPDLILLWDSLEELASEPDAYFNLSEKNKTKLRSIVLRGNAAQFLFGIKGQTILLPQHLKALKSLKSDEELQEAISKGSEFSNQLIKQREKKDEKALKRYEREIEELMKEIKVIEKKELPTILSSLTEAEKSKYNDAQTTLKDKWERKFLLIFKDVKLAFNGENDFETFLKQYFDAYERDETEGPSERRIKLCEQIVRKLKELSEFVVQEDQVEEKDKVRARAGKAIRKSENIQLLERFEEILQEIKEKQIDFDNAKKEIKTLSKTPINDVLNDLQKKKKEIDQKYASKAIEDDFLAELVDHFAKPKEKAIEIDDNYWKSLKNRIEKHQLHAADLEVLWDEEYANDADDSNNITESERALEFRDRFKEVLNVQLEKIQLDEDQIIGNSEDRFAPWIEKVNRYLSIGKLTKELERQGISIPNKNPQIVSELIHGAINYYKKDILAGLDVKLKNSSGLDLEERQQFINQLRLHHKISTPQEIREIDSAYNRYFNLRRNSGKDMQEERNKMDGVLSTVFEKNISEILEDVLDPELHRNEREEVAKQLLGPIPKDLGQTEEQFIMSTLDSKLNKTLSEKERNKILKQVQILRAFNKNKEWLNEGSGLFPGREKLNEARLQMEPVRSEVNKLLSVFSDKLFGVKSLCKTEGNEKKIKIAFIEFFTLWKNEIRGEFKKLIEEVKEECLRLFNEPKFKDFFEVYFSDLSEIFEKMDETMVEMETNFESGYWFTGEEKAFYLLGLGKDWFYKYLNFRDGFWAGTEEAISKQFNSQADTVICLKDWGLFDDEYDEDGNLVKSGESKAKEKFNKLQSEFNEEYIQFRDSLKFVKSVIEKDIDVLNDDKFFVKYKVDKNSVEELLVAYDKNLLDFESLWQQFQTPDFFTRWLERYNENAESRAEALNDFCEWENLTKTVKEVELHTKGMKEWLKNAVDWKNKSNFFGNGGIFGIGYNITSQNFSLNDVFEIIKKTIENINTQWQRRSDRAVAGIGKQVFGNTFIGKEFQRMSEESESQRVKQFEEGYHDLTAWDIRAAMYRSNDKDEVRACVNMLKEKGFFKWDDPEFWRVLMRFQNNVSFNIPEDMNLAATDLKDKIKNACETVWSREIYRQWETSYEDDLKKAKSGWSREFADLEQQGGERGRILSEMLQKWSRGDAKEVDPSKYESFLFEAFKKGKMNTQPDKRWYFLVKGVSTRNPQGQALLSKEIFSRINDEFLSGFPFVDFFTDEGSWKLNGRIVPPNTKGAIQRPWKYDDYLAWGEFLGDAGGSFSPNAEPAYTKTKDFFYHYILQSDQAVDRAGRMHRVAGGEGDHDDGQSYFAAWTQNQVLQTLASRSEGTQQVTNDMWRQFLNGFDVYMEEMRKYIRQGDSEYGEDENWQKRRKETLLRVGDRLRVAFTATQVLQGNKNTMNQTPLVFDKREWEKDTTSGYCPKADSSRKNINNFMREILLKKGNLDEYESIFDYKGSEISLDKIKREENETWKEKNKLAEKILSGEGGSTYFMDTEVIWETLREYKGIENTSSVQTFYGKYDNAV
ncbi:hypothetical protein KAI58_04975 [Candidatus Gracilibacteria bacterium]|nr:hypothetical protein [Candidatus Gracilibacteria bacterium]